MTKIEREQRRIQCLRYMKIKIAEYNAWMEINATSFNWWTQQKKNDYTLNFVRYKI